MWARQLLPVSLLGFLSDFGLHFSISLKSRSELRNEMNDAIWPSPFYWFST